MFICFSHGGVIYLSPAARILQAEAYIKLQGAKFCIILTGKLECNTFRSFEAGANGLLLGFHDKDAMETQRAAGGETVIQKWDMRLAGRCTRLCDKPPLVTPPVGCFCT